MVLLKKRTFTPCCEISLSMEKKEIVKKNSSKCELLMVLERMEMGEGVKKVLKEDVKRKRSYDKFIGFIGKKKKLGNGLKECDLEENGIKWKEFRVSFVSIISVVFESLLIII